MNRQRTLLIILSAMLFGGPRGAAFQDEWRLTTTDHFDITFRTIGTADLQRIARSAERAYQHVGAALMHELSLRPLIVVYQTRGDLDRAIASRSFPGNREHMLWALDIPAAEADGTFVHELTHVFAFDIVPVSVRRDLPGWLQEGLAEFERGEWTDADLGIVRGLLRTNTFPTLTAFPRADSDETTRLQRIVGHLAVDFLAARAGQDIVKPLLLSLRENVSSPIEAYLAAAELSAADFDRAFARYARDRFAA
jgi:hypothetical protein